MLKKFVFILIVFVAIVAGLQLFGDRDFAQVSIAWDKYQHGGNISSLSSDVVDIFAGNKINQGGLDSAKMAERLIYRWTDDQGVVHNSERMPKVANYEVIRMGDLKMETRKAMDKEEIDRALQKEKPKDN